MNRFQVQQLVTSVSDDKDMGIELAIKHVASMLGKDVTLIENMFYNSEMKD